MKWPAWHIVAEVSQSVDRENNFIIMDSVSLINYNEFIKLNIIFVCASIMNPMLKLFIANNYIFKIMSSSKLDKAERGTEVTCT